MKYNYLIFSVLLSTVFFAQESNCQKVTELAPSPPMGWNSWNYHGKSRINEKIVIETIDSMVETGLKDAGYTYIVIDGGWRDTVLAPNGALLPHPEKFPNGIKYLADYAHSKGLKLGVHVVPGTHDCGGDEVGAYGFEEVHLQQFIDWGLDMIKLDQCTHRDNPCFACLKHNSGWNEQLIKDTYTKWSYLLANAPRDILFSISAYQFRDWYPETCNMARTTGDIRCRLHGKALFNTHSKNTYSVIDIAESNNLSADYAGDGYWNDPDMMVIGDHGLTEQEQISHFALWCIMSSPLMLGNDPRHMNSFEKELITNREMIAVNQDPSEQGKIIQDKEYEQLWVKKLSNGNLAVLLLNLDRRGIRKLILDPRKLEVKGAEILVRDLVEKKDSGKLGKGLEINLAPNQCGFFLLSPQ